MLGPATLFGHNRYEDEDFRDTFLTKSLIMLPMSFFIMIPILLFLSIYWHRIKLLAKMTKIMVRIAISNMMLLAMSKMLVLLTNRDDDNVLDVKDANFVPILYLPSS